MQKKLLTMAVAGALAAPCIALAQSSVEVYGTINMAFGKFKYSEQKKVINQAAADWVYRNGDLTEPWLFEIGSNGRIVDRWENLIDLQDVRQDLQKLPPMH